MEGLSRRSRPTKKRETHPLATLSATGLTGGEPSRPLQWRIRCAHSVGLRKADARIVGHRTCLLKARECSYRIRSCSGELVDRIAFPRTSAIVTSRRPIWKQVFNQFNCLRRRKGRQAHRRKCSAPAPRSGPLDRRRFRKRRTERLRFSSARSGRDCFL